MQYSIALLGLVAAVTALPQGTTAVTEDISPEAGPPEGCSTSYDGEFQIQVVNVSSTSTKRSYFNKRQEDEATLLITLQDGVLTDDEDRTGYIAANRQFQFDGPPQAGAIYTSGFSVCQNGSLAIGDDAVFYQCLSGTFYNLYDEAQAAQCNQVYINVVGADTTAPAASQIPDGQVTAVPVSSAAPVTQIGDGQVQASTSVVPVSQIPDGQASILLSNMSATSKLTTLTIQATTAPVVSQIGDGQVQAPTSAPVVSQIGDGQIQAPTSAPVVSQIADGQIQAPSGASGMPTMPANGTMATATPSVQLFEGAAASNMVAGSLVALVAGIFGVVAL